MCVVVVLSSSTRVRAQGNSRLVLRQRLEKNHSEAHSRFADELNQLAAWCDERRIVGAGEAIRKLASPIETRLLRDARLPRLAEEPIPENLSPGETEYRGRLRAIRREYAAEIYRLSRSALRTRFVSYAMQLVREVTFHDPDHKSARAVLGYRRFTDPDRRDDPSYAGEWVTRFEASKRLPPTRHIWHDRFGWILKAHVDRYEGGERYYKRRWISVEREAELRRDFRNAWVVETEHFKVRTNVSLERGVEVAKALEDFHAFLLTTFASFFETPAELEKRFAGSGSRSSRVRPRQMDVHYFASRDEYNTVVATALKLPVSTIAMTNGTYLEGTQTSCFFDQPDKPEAQQTLFHEATHQILDLHTTADRLRAINQRAGRSGARRPWVIAEHDNYWIVEGIACYMESFRRDGGVFSLGDPEHGRFQHARYRMVEDNWYRPLAEFSAMGRDEFQADPELARVYTQSSGLAHFLMHYDNGRYRDALIELLSQLYRPNLRQSIPSLDKLTDTPLPRLDAQYRAYMESWVPTAKFRTSRRP